MTKEEYKENLIRMWDSLRGYEYKGGINCIGVECCDCPLNKKMCNTAYNTAYGAVEAIEIVENWVKEHPIKTNAMKFEEVFGFEPLRDCCLINKECRDCKLNGEKNCSETFWNAEYKPMKEGEVNEL